MERDVMPMHSSTPPPLDGDEEVELEEDNLGDFDGISRGASSLSFPEPPCSLRQPCSIVLPTTSAPEHFIKLPCRNGLSPEEDPVYGANSKPAVDCSPPASTLTSSVTPGVSRVQEEVQSQSCRGGPSPSFEDDNFRETLEYSASVTTSESMRSTTLPNEETGFADFSVFTEPVLHPWCCGFTPGGDGSPWEPGTESTQPAKRLAEPGSCRGADKGGRVCTEVQHCEQRVTAVTRRAQDHPHHSQGPVTGTPPSEQVRLEDEVPGDSREKMHGSSRGIKPPQALELEQDRDLGEESVSSLLPQTGSEPASEDFASFCDIVSPDGLLEDFGDLRELDLASVTPRKEHPEELWEKMAPHLEERVGAGVENCREADSFTSRDFSDRDQSLCREHAGSHQSARDRSDDLSLSDSRKLVEEGLAVFKEEPCGDDGDSSQVQELGETGGALGVLPPSDSFADFCSAPLEDNSLDQEREGDGGWEVCGEQALSQSKTWATVQEGDVTEKSENVEEKGGSLQGSLSSRVQKLLQASFPEVRVPVGEEEVEDIPSLTALLQAPGGQPEDSDDRRPDVLDHSSIPPFPGAPQGLWHQPQEVHDAVGLRFQWGGSHSNRTLLKCLDIDTRNILFCGQRKQPVIVPAFAANLGMLEPTKEPLQTALSARQAVTTAQASSASQGTRDSTQEAHHLSQVNWSSGGLSNPQDGVDPDLLELTTAKVDCTYDNSRLEETFNRLMSTVKGTSTFVRKPQHDQELSEEAISVIHGLTDITFMQARVLMFPSILTPSEDGTK